MCETKLVRIKIYSYLATAREGSGKSFISGWGEEKV